VRFLPLEIRKFFPQGRRAGDYFLEILHSPNLICPAETKPGFPVIRRNAGADAFGQFSAALSQCFELPKRFNQTVVTNRRIDIKVLSLPDGSERNKHHN
jgi:hypothetical protein